MPHQCTNCGRTFPDGSKEMLSGCPDCGGNKFQFAPSSAAHGDASAAQSGDSSTPPEPPSEEATDSVAARAAETVRDFVSTDTNLSDTSETAGDVSSQPESSPETQATQSAETQTTPGTEKQSAPDTETQSASDTETQSAPGTEPQPPTQAENSSGTRAENSSATGDKPGRTTSEEPVQNHVSDWTTASDSDDVPSSSGEFPEWPDSARPPEDRSTADSALEDTDPEAEGAAPKRADTERTEPDPAGTERTHTEQTGPDRTDTVRTGSAETTDIDRTGSAETTDIDRTGSAETTGTDRTGPTESEDTAQASARSDVVPSDELPDSTAPIEDATAPDHGRVVSEPTGEQPSLEDLRAELNEQFESIKILKPGQYELNLMELYNREEYIISLQEDGRYVIDVPDSWRDGDEE